MKKNILFVWLIVGVVIIIVGLAVFFTYRKLSASADDYPYNYSVYTPTPSYDLDKYTIPKPDWSGLDTGKYTDKRTGDLIRETSNIKRIFVSCMKNIKIKPIFGLMRLAIQSPTQLLPPKWGCDGQWIVNLIPMLTANV